MMRYIIRALNDLCELFFYQGGANAQQTSSIFFLNAHGQNLDIQTHKYFNLIILISGADCSCVWRSQSEAWW